MVGTRLFGWNSAVLAVAVCVPLTAAPARRVNGIPNFHKVNEHVYRGGQPSEEGFRNLAASGMKTILDLREDDERGIDEKQLVRYLGMRYVNIPMRGMTTPSEQQISKALKVLNDGKSGPVFVHCKRGADRTGVVIACYRVQHDSWRREDALGEARELGMSWYQLPLIQYVLSYRGLGDDGAGGLREVFN